MAMFRAEKVVASLPSPLAPDTLYVVRTGVGFDPYVSDATGSVAHRINYPAQAGVPLGRWEVTAAASLTADNVFDDSLYSHYTITGQFRPATNGADLTAVLRSSELTDVGGGMRIGGAFARLDASGAGTAGPLAVLASNINSTPGNGVTWFQLVLHMRDGSYQGIDFAVRYGTSTGPTYAGQYNGEFLTIFPRQGIKFSFSSGNIAEGWIEITGHLKQAA